MMNRSSIIIFGRWFRFIFHMKEHQKLAEIFVFYIKVKDGRTWRGETEEPDHFHFEMSILSTKQNVD